MRLQVTDLTKRYGRLTALSGVSFSIGSGEVLGPIGPNGSGKTTLFECLESRDLEEIFLVLT